MTTNDPRGPRRTFRLPATSDRIDAELQEEFRFHIEERIEQFMAQGLSRADAEAEVQRRFGDYDSHRELTRQIDRDTIRQRRRSNFLRALTTEVRRSARLLLRTPAFTTVAFLTLAVGIGATTAIYSVLDAVVLRPLPYRNSDRLVSLLHPATVPGSGERKWGLSTGGYLQFKSRSQTMSDMGLYRSTGMTVTNGGEAEMVQVGVVTSSIFTTLRARPFIGRLTDASDDVEGAPQVAVLSYEFFKRRFASDTSVIGKNLETGGGVYQIIGVAEPGLTLPMPGPFSSTSNLAGFGVDVWRPLQINPAGPFYNNHPYVGIGRLADKATVQAAQTEFAAVMSSFTDILPNVYSPKFIEQYNFRIEVAPLRNAVLGEKVPRTLWMLFGAVSIVLLIAAANVSNLFMVRIESRRRESAIRTALGADRTHMAAHFLSESLLLCVTAGIAAVLLAAVGLRAVLAIAPTDIPRLAAVTLTWRSTAIALAIAFSIGLLLGVVPLLRRAIDITSLRDSSRGLSASPRQRATRNVLVLGQIALALVLLAAAGLMTRSFNQLRRVEPGFNPANVLAFTISLPFSEYDTREKALAFHRELDLRLKTIEGVKEVGGTSSIPLEDYGTGCTVVFREKRPYATGEQTPCVATPIALPGFFEALHIPVEGRTPTWGDINGRTQAVVITRALADRLWPGENPIGKGIGSNGTDSDVWYHIVGVAPSIRAEALDLPPTEAVFYAATDLRTGRRDGSVNDITFFVRTEGIQPLNITQSVRKAVAELNPRVPVMDPRSMTSIVEHSMARTSFIMIMLALAAAVALSLSLVGIYGVISYVVAQRRGEIGIRMALGATVPDVVWMVVLQSARLAVVGVTLGTVGAFWTSRTLRSLLFDVSPTDPLVLTTAALSVLVIAMLASAAPARRAARIDPVEAMRGE